MNAFQAIFFDFDGVLLDLEPLHYEAWVNILKKLGYEPPFTLDLEEVIGISDWEIGRAIIHQWGMKLTLDELLSLKQKEYRRLIDTNGFDTREVEAVLKQLKPKFELDIVSSSLSTEIAHILEKQKLLPYFSCIVGGEATEKHKPDPAPYLEALRQTKMKPAQVVVIEDSEAGLLSATAAGLKAIWFNRYNAPPTPFFEKFISVRSFSELLGHLL